uniref:Uncharacterized protein n=1 Tax=Palpitomonas bilix TaxID=652834 RepID=A0A7S3GK44_9EUKA|mmetsp:Transcript_6868/g.17300  ORF Transcript_6868/g.17300 Transcript_6868/m.17300 type:complete len:113 (+) Transcript_6868:363-701(+)
MILLPHQASSGAVSKKRDGDEVDLIEDTPMKELERLNISTFTSWKKKNPLHGLVPQRYSECLFRRAEKESPCIRWRLCAGYNCKQYDRICSSTTVVAIEVQIVGHPFVPGNC